MITISLATELPSAQPTDELTKPPEHKSRQLDEIVTLEWSPHLLLTILRCLKEVNCSRIIADCGCVFRYFSAPSMTVCDLIGHWIVSADTVGCEPEPDPIAIAVRLEPVLLLEKTQRNKEQREPQ